MYVTGGSSLQFSAFLLAEASINKASEFSKLRTVNVSGEKYLFCYIFLVTLYNYRGINAHKIKLLGFIRVLVTCHSFILLIFAVLEGSVCPC